MRKRIRLFFGLLGFCVTRAPGGRAFLVHPAAAVFFLTRGGAKAREASLRWKNEGGRLTKEPFRRLSLPKNRLNNQQPCL